MRKCVYVTLAAMLLSTASTLHAQDNKAAIQQRLAAQFVLTKITSDGTDIVTPGSVLVLKKDGLIMFALGLKATPTTTYKDGKLSMSFGDAMATTLLLGGNQTASTVPQRKFVTGEKVWITAYSVTDKHVILLLYSDPINDVHYYGQIKLPFQKHNIPTADDVMKTIAEVIDVQPPDTSTQDTTEQNQESGSTTPKTISLGQTKDDVIAALGQPQKVVNLGAKEIYIYSDMKVTFMNGRVSDVQ
jgi:hypothetical protein